MCDEERKYEQLLEQAMVPRPRRLFAQRLEHVNELPDAVSKRTILLADARVKHEIESAGSAGGVTGGGGSRFTLRTGGWGKPKACLVLEARCLVHADSLVRRGYDAEPAGEAELTDLLSRLAAEGKRGDCFRVVLLGSPTGWEKAAAKLITEPDSGGGFRDRKVAVVLWDLRTDTAMMDESDVRLRAFWPVVSPSRYAAEQSRCMAKIRTLCESWDGLPLKDAVRECEAEAATVRSAFERLTAEEKYTVVDVPGVGDVLRRPA